MKYFLSILFICCASTFYAQGNDPVYDVVQKMPQFPGGNEAKNQFIAENLNYPPEAYEQGIEGRVYVQFIVRRSGELTDINVIRSPSDYLSKEAIRVIKLMPNWSPGEQSGEKVSVKFVLPISFILRKVNDEE